MGIEKGDRYGRLTVIDKAPGRRIANSTKPYWTCRCDCGKVVIVRAEYLTSGHTKSCGCLNRDITSEYNSTHKLGDSRLYHIWYNMHQKCENPNNSSYNSVGAKGIRVCEEWSNPEGLKRYALQQHGNQGFMNFYKWAMDNYPETAETQPLTRIDKTKDYSPDNCHFEKDKKNYHKGDTKYIFDGSELLTYRQFDIKYGLAFGSTAKRAREGITDSEIVYAAKHQDLGMKLCPERYTNKKNQFGRFVDKDGFVHMIPRVAKHE